MLYLSLLFSISIILLTIISCSADSSSNIFGKWECVGFEGMSGQKFKEYPPGARGPLEIFSDKTLDYVGENCKWAMLENGRIKITSSDGRVFYGQLQGDILKIQGGQGTLRRQFRKMK